MPLSLKLNKHEFTLSDKCLTAMAAAVLHTKVKERGFALCQYPEITPSEEHIGGPGSITERNCRGKPPRVGSFHTHPPHSPSSPSWWDAYTIMSQTYRHGIPWLGCRGSKFDGEIRCDTVKDFPSLATLHYFQKKRREMRYVAAEDDPDMWQHFAHPYSFALRDVPKIIKPPAPVPAAPRIKSEELVFAQSKFVRYTNLDTGETRVERVY